MWHLSDVDALSRKGPRGFAYVRHALLQPGAGDAPSLRLALLPAAASSAGEARRAGERRRVIVLQALSEQEREDWMAALVRAGADSHTPPGGTRYDRLSPRVSF